MCTCGHARDDHAQLFGNACEVRGCMCQLFTPVPEQQ